MDIFGLVSIDPLYTYKHSMVLASIVRNFEKTVVSHLRHMKSVQLWNTARAVPCSLTKHV